MKDRDFLLWIYTRLHCVHREDTRLDYMRKLGAIVQATPKDQDTSPTAAAVELKTEILAKRRRRRN